MPKGERLIFGNIIQWLYEVNAVFDVDHVVILTKTYWLDSESDMKALYSMWAYYGNKTGENKADA